MDVAPLSDEQYLSRIVLTTCIGTIQLFRGFESQWTREESLSEVDSIELVDLPERSVAEHKTELDKGAGVLIRGIAVIVDGLGGVLYVSFQLCQRNLMVALMCS